jgi:hypothetical protein
VIEEIAIGGTHRDRQFPPPPSGARFAETIHPEFQYVPLRASTPSRPADADCQTRLK